jgi:site-specific DNA-methyltransferase (adenine-specific)
MGDRLCHLNEAPFSEFLCEFFIRSLCPEHGLVIDPFSGSGTTAKVCRALGRNCLAIDIRESQSKLARKRLAQGVLI